MEMTAQAALQFREDFMHVVGSHVGTYNFGDYEITSIVIVPKSLALSDVWTDQHMDCIANDCYVYQKKMAPFYVMCTQKYLDPHCAIRMDNRRRASNHPSLSLLTSVLAFLGLEWDANKYK
jgi:hypothetical protein